MKKVTYSQTAIKEMRRIPANTAKRIRTKINAYAVDPASQGNNVKALQGSEFLRLRVGDYRVIFSEDLTILLVERVRHRKDVYR